MAFVNNTLYSLLNETTKEIVGLQNISVKDTSTFLSMGNAVLSSEQNTSEFYSALFQQIAKVSVRARKLARKSLNLEVDNITFGAIIQRIGTSKIARTRASESYKNDGLNNPFKYVDTTSIVSQLFKARDTFDIETKVILKNQLEQAFRSEAEMQAFINLIYVDIDNAFELAERDLEHLTFATMIANAINAGGAQAVNLLAEYNLTHASATLTAATCLENKDFLAYASRQIKRCKGYMEELSTSYNSLRWEKESNPDELEVKMHTDFVSASEYYLESNTFHNTFVTLPTFEEFKYIQANDGTFATTSTIDIKNGGIVDGDDALLEVHQSGIICVIHDKEAAAVTYKNRRMGSMYNADNEREYIYPKEDWGALVDKSGNVVVFYIADAS